MKKTTHDILIVGGGIAGLCVAQGLAQSTDLHIALVETKTPSFDWLANTYGLRVSAITKAY